MISQLKFLKISKKSAFTLFSCLMVLLSCVFLSYSPALADQAYGSGNYGTCLYPLSPNNPCSVSLTSDANVSLNVTPTSSGACTINEDSPSVLTDDANGYTLTVSDSSTSSALNNGVSTIGSTSGTPSSPSMLSDSWGYRVDGLANFGSGPTTAISSTPSSAVFAGLPNSSQTSAIIATTSSAADPAVATNVWYGICADTSVVGSSSATYTTTVLYTAVTND
jgi:hypothetical protein